MPTFRDRHSTLRNIPEVWRSHLHRDRSLKSRLHTWRLREDQKQFSLNYYSRKKLHCLISSETERHQRCLPEYFPLTHNNFLHNNTLLLRRRGLIERKMKIFYLCHFSSEGATCYQTAYCVCVCVCVCVYVYKFVTIMSGHRLGNGGSIPHKVQVCSPRCSVQTGVWGTLDITTNR